MAERWHMGAGYAAADAGHLEGEMKAIAMLLVVGAMLAGQTLERPVRPATKTEWAEYELAVTDATTLRDQLKMWKRYCDAHEGLSLGTPSLWVTPKGKVVAAFAHPTFANPLKVTKDAEGNVVSVSGGNRILVMPRALADKLAGQLCFPGFRDGRADRLVVRRMFKALMDSGKVRMLRRLPGTWKPVEPVGP